MQAAFEMAKLKSKGIAISDIDELQNLTGSERTDTEDVPADILVSC